MLWLENYGVTPPQQHLLTQEHSGKTALVYEIEEKINCIISQYISRPWNLPVEGTFYADTLTHTYSQGSCSRFRKTIDITTRCKERHHNSVIVRTQGTSRAEKRSTPLKSKSKGWNNRNDIYENASSRIGNPSEMSNDGMKGFKRRPGDYAPTPRLCI